jgi:hypothetical protein
LQRQNARPNPGQFGAIRNEPENLCFARDCVVGLEGLELRAKHAVISNVSPIYHKLGMRRDPRAKFGRSMRTCDLRLRWLLAQVDFRSYARSDEPFGQPDSRVLKFANLRNTYCGSMADFDK